MSSISTGSAQAYVAGLVLPAPRPHSLEAAEASSLPEFTAAKDQAMIVGSDIVSFVKGVTPEWRADIARSSLLAQLAAKKRVQNKKDIYKWYEAYFDVLMNVGWIIQDRGFAVYREANRDFETHEAIMKVAASLLGPSAATLAVVKATLDALKSMAANSPWITLFNRESRSASTARFQINLVETGDKGEQLIVSMMAFGLEATSTLTQVLFAKFRSNDVSVKQYSSKISIEPSVLESVRDLVSKRVEAYARNYVRTLPDF
jgi:hypothetical protein